MFVMREIGEKKFAAIKQFRSEEKDRARVGLVSSYQEGGKKGREEKKNAREYRRR